MINLLLICSLLYGAQDTPTDIAKKDLPKAAECVVCALDGAEHGLERPAAGVNFKGKAYYFCNASEVKDFKADPEAFMAPVLPRPIPTFDLVDTAKKRWNGEALAGRVVLIDWWATWCGPCKEMMPVLDKIYQRNREKGLELLSVSIDEKKAAFDKFVAKGTFKNPVLWDDKQTWAGFHIRVIPMLYLVKDGQIVNQWRGKQKSETIEAAVASALAK